MLSIGVLVLFSIIGIGIIPLNHTKFVYIEGIDATLEYKINFNYYKIGCEKPSYIDIHIRGEKIYFEQVFSIYCNVDESTFWLDGIGNKTIISILQIFEPNGSVARCICSIMIKGALGNFNNQSFILEFIAVNNYVDQNHTIESFQINM